MWAHLAEVTADDFSLADSCDGAQGCQGGGVGSSHVGVALCRCIIISIERALLLCAILRFSMYNWGDMGDSGQAGTALCCRVHGREHPMDSRCVELGQNHDESLDSGWISSAVQLAHSMEHCADLADCYSWLMWILTRPNR